MIETIESQKIGWCQWKTFGVSDIQGRLKGQHKLSSPARRKLYQAATANVSEKQAFGFVITDSNTAQNHKKSGTKLYLQVYQLRQINLRSSIRILY